MHLNYNHLLYFYSVAKQGGVHRAADKLCVTPQTISGQIATMEKNLGYPLFNRVDKRLELTEMGRVAFSYAEEIFRLGDELRQMLASGQAPEGRNLTVGVLDSVPKILAYDLLKICVHEDFSLKLHVCEGDLERLLSDFAINKIDLILSDRPMPSYLGVKGFNHKITESGFTCFVSQLFDDDISGDFPECLNGMPMLISGDRSIQKNLILSWLESRRIQPRVIAEFDDTALMKLFGQGGQGFFFSPTIIEAFILQQYSDIRVVGRTKSVTEQFFAITPQRRIADPVIQKMIDMWKKMEDFGG